MNKLGNLQDMDDLKNINSSRLNKEIQGILNRTIPSKDIESIIKVKVSLLSSTNI
jgi:flagellar biosynthesis/type III secretory pathway chaperone